MFNVLWKYKAESYDDRKSLTSYCAFSSKWEVELYFNKAITLFPPTESESPLCFPSPGKQDPADHYPRQKWEGCLLTFSVLVWFFSKLTWPFMEEQNSAQRDKDKINRNDITMNSGGKYFSYGGHMSHINRGHSSIWMVFRGQLFIWRCPLFVRLFDWLSAPSPV